MKITISTAVVSAILSGQALADCTPQSLVGDWQCTGSGCTPGKGLSHMSIQGSALHWVDGVGSGASVNLDGNGITMFFNQGNNAVNGTLDANCVKIDWGGGHWDYKVSPAGN